MDENIVCMDENTAPSFVVKAERVKNISRKGPLSVINGDIIDKKKSNKTSKVTKPLKQVTSVINPYLPTTQTFQIFEDNEDDTENKNSVVEKVVSVPPIPSSNASPSENSHSSPLENSHSSPSENSHSSPECIGLSPGVQTDAFYSFSKRKKEMVLQDVTYTPYRDDILKYFTEIEGKFLANSSYMAKQTDLTMSMRSILVDWMVEVAEEYKLHVATLHHAVSYVDRFLSKVAVKRCKLQLVGTTCMFLASKYEEIYPPELSDFVFITDNTYTKQQILRMEHLVLKVLNFELAAPTPYTILQLYCSISNASDVLMNLSQYICELTLVDGYFLGYRPSFIAAAAFAFSNYILENDMLWNDKMESMTGYKLEKLYMGIIHLHTMLKELPSKPQQAICEKYKSPKYGSVSTIKIPRALDFRPLKDQTSPLIEALVIEVTE